MDSSLLQAVALAPVPTAYVYSASDYGGLFVRWLRIAFTYVTHLDIIGF